MAATPKVWNIQQQFSKIPVLGLVMEGSAAASPPANPVNGQFWYDQTNHRAKVYENGAWVNASLTGAELTANKGQANGYASLDAGSKVPIAQIPTGTTGTTVALGNDSRFTDSRTPTGSAGGDLTGTYPNPTVANLAITDAKVAAANKDGLATTPSMRTLGTGATQAAAGNDARFTDARTPTGSAGGDLTGTYPNPTLGTGVVDDTNVAAANKDGAAATPSMRTLGTGATQALPGNIRLDQIAAPTSALGLNGQRLTNLATPTADGDAATKAYVDSARSGLDVKESVRAATTANITLSGIQTIDGVTLVAGDRVLVKNQSSASANGIYLAASGAWTRATDFDSNAEVTSGAFTFVEEGTTQGATGWVLSTANPITVDTTALTFAKFSDSASLSAGAGLVQNGNAFDVVGTANRITVNADSIDIAATYVGQTSITTLGTIATGTWNATTIALNKGGTGATTAAAARTNLGATGKYAADLGALTAGVETANITHNLGTTDVQVQIRRVSDGAEEEFGWRVVDANNIRVVSDVAYATGLYRVVVVG